MQVEDSDSDDGQHDMDSDDVGQRKVNEVWYINHLFLCQEVDYGSGDEMEEDDGDMFVDEDLDLQARSGSLLLSLSLSHTYLFLLCHSVTLMK